MARLVVEATEPLGNLLIAHHYRRGQLRRFVLYPAMFPAFAATFSIFWPSFLAASSWATVFWMRGSVPVGLACQLGGSDQVGGVPGVVRGAGHCGGAPREQQQDRR